MPYFKKSKILFVHIPKTAGTSCEELLNDSDITLFTGKMNGERLISNKLPIKENMKAPSDKIKQHLTAREIFNYDIDVDYSFSFVRNPYERAISMWKHQTHAKPFFNRYYTQIKYRVRNDFNEWVAFLYKIYKDGNLRVIKHNCPQVDFIFDDKDRLMVHELFSFEEIDSFEILGKKLPKVNSIKTPTNLKITDESYRMINEIYAKDFEMLGYSTDPSLSKNSPTLPVTYTICIKTFNRPKCLEACLKSFSENTDSRRIIVVDDSTVPIRRKENLEIVKKQDLDIKYIYAGEDIGLSKGRNIAVSHVKTKALLLIDDNATLPKYTPFSPYVDYVLEGTVDLVGFIFNPVFSRQRFKTVEIEGGIYKIITKRERETYYPLIKDNMYKRDIVTNMFVTTKELCEKYPWDNRLKLGEHLPWFSVLWKNNIKVGEINKKLFEKVYFNYNKDPKYIKMRNRARSHQVSEIWRKYHRRIDKED